MSFQGSTNQLLGIAQGVASKVKSEQVRSNKELERQLKSKSRKTADFKNYNHITANKSAETLKQEIRGKKQQQQRISNRIANVKKKFNPNNAIHRNID